MIVLDTHSWIWWVDQSSQLSATANRALERVSAEYPVLISSMSVWEIHMLVSRGKLKLKTDVSHWVRQCELSRKIRFVPVDNDIARISVQLPHPAPEDPADRLIIATALFAGAKLVTKDSKIRACGAVETIW